MVQTVRRGLLVLQDQLERPGPLELVSQDHQDRPDPLGLMEPPDPQVLPGRVAPLERLGPREPQEPLDKWVHLDPKDYLEIPDHRGHQVQMVNQDCQDLLVYQDQRGPMDRMVLPEQQERQETLVYPDQQVLAVLLVLQDSQGPMVRQGLRVPRVIVDQLEDRVLVEQQDQLVL